jgi:hypothetical protein
MLARAVLDRVSSINDLGVIMDEKMNFSEHVDVMVGKAFAILGFIRRHSTRPWFVQNWNTKAECGAHSKTCA